MKNNFHYLALFGELGFIVVFSLLFYIFLYKQIEKFIGFNIIVFILAILLGLISSFYYIYRRIFKD